MRTIDKYYQLYCVGKKGGWTALRYSDSVKFFYAHFIQGVSKRVIIAPNKAFPRDNLWNIKFLSN